MGTLDATYEKADLPKVIFKNCGHLDSSQQAKLLKLLQKYEELFDSSLGDFQMDPVTFDPKDGVKPYQGKVFQVPHAHKMVFKKEVGHLVEISVLKEQPQSGWGSPVFIIAKKDGSVRFLTLLSLTASLQPLLVKIAHLSFPSSALPNPKHTRPGHM